MIEKLVIQKLTIAGKEYEYPDTTALVGKINELADVVNALIKENNIHEMQIDELQMKAEPQKCETPVENVQKWIHWDNDEVQRYGAIARGFKNLRKEPADPYAEQRKWIGKLCRFWDDNYKITKHFGILTRIDETAIVRYEAENGFWYCACEPVKPDDDIIYKGGDNE